MEASKEAGELRQFVHCCLLMGNSIPKYYLKSKTLIENTRKEGDIRIKVKKLR